MLKVSCFLDLTHLRIRDRVGPYADQRCDHLQRVLFEAIRFFGDFVVPNEEMLYISRKNIPLNSLSIAFKTPILIVNRESCSKCTS